MSSTFERSGRCCVPHIFIFILMLCLVPLATPAAAGQAQEASIIGQVRDESGGVLPGVTVTATSPALQVPQVTGVTDERGEYRLTPLPLGTYAVQYELAGFGIVRREDVRLTAGFTARIDIALKVGALAETVTVSGAAPVVDVASTAARTQLTRETLELIPTGRSGLQSVMVQAPGVRTNLDFGAANAGNPPFRAFGQSFGAWSTLDNAINISPKSAGPGSGTYTDITAYEEAVVQTLGSNAEAPTRGIQMNIIVKSGGNDFHGGGYWSQSSQNLTSDNLDNALRAQGIRSGNPLDARWDRSADLGGRVIRNKLWFYTALRASREDRVILNAFKPDGSPAISRGRQVFSTTKVSYQMTPANKIIGLYQIQHTKSEGGTVSQFVAWESQQKSRSTCDGRPTEWGPSNCGLTSKLEWQLVKGNKFLSVLVGNWQFRVLRDGLTNAVRTEDQITQLVTGQSRQTPHRQGEGRKHSRGSLSWYEPDLFYGNHDFKVGFDYSPGMWSDGKVLDRKVHDGGENYGLIFRNGVPFQIEAHNNPTIPSTAREVFKSSVSPHNPVDYLGVYGQDSWTLARRLTLNLGVRYAYDSGHISPQCREASLPPLDVVFPAQCWSKIQFNVFHSVVPRLHAAYDVTGDGRTVIKGGWGRFAKLRYVDEVQMTNPNVHLLAFFRWHDLNGNKAFELGEVNFDRNGPDFLFERLELGSGTDSTVGGAVPNPDEKQPLADEFSASIERQLLSNLAVRVTGVYSRNINSYRIRNNLRPYEVYNIPITNPDPGPDGTRGTADDPGTFVTYYDYPAALAGRAFQQPTLINDRRSDSDFKSVEVAASRRLANRWQFMASYSATKLHIPFVPNTPDDARLVSLATFDPNAEINSANNTWEWLGRLSGAYIFPYDVQISGNFEHRSGDPWGRQVSFTGGQQIPSLTVRVEPIGTRQLPHVNILHLRAEKAFQLRQGHKVALRANVYNALNINTVLAVTQLSSRNFLRPRTIAPPRFVDLVVQYTF